MYQSDFLNAGASRLQIFRASKGNPLTQESGLVRGTDELASKFAEK